MFEVEPNLPDVYKNQGNHTNSLYLQHSNTNEVTKIIKSLINYCSTKYNFFFMKPTGVSSAALIVFLIKSCIECKTLPYQRKESGSAQFQKSIHHH